MRRLAEPGELGLEGCDLRAHDVGAGAHHLQDGVFQRLAQTGALGLQVDERNGHGQGLAESKRRFIRTRRPVTPNTLVFARFRF